MIQQNVTNGFMPGEPARIAPTGSGVLDGLSFAVKDLIDIAGHRTGGGNPDWLAAALPAVDHAPIVARLLRAGATCIGKTITDELAFSLEGANLHYGAPLNPVCSSWLPGGSSSGSAVAVASGAADFALGTDTGGSVRVPAAFCRIFGFRPSHGALSLDGVLPFSPSYDTIGWFARDTRLLEQVGQILLPPGTPTPVTSIRLAGDVLRQVRSDIAADITAAATGVVTGEPIDILAGASLAELQQTYSTIQGYEIQGTLGEQLNALQPHLGAAIAQRFRQAMAITQDQYKLALVRRAHFSATIDAAIPPGTAIMLPVVSVRYLERDRQGANLGDFYMKSLGLTAIAGHGGLPQVQLGMKPRGMPIGASLLGARHTDRALLALARQIEDQRT